MPVRNAHERLLPAPPERVGELLDGLASDGDRLWPRDDWPAMRLDKPLGAGARGGHGPVRYTVEEYEPGRRVRFRFRSPRGFDGHHEFAVRPGPGGAVLSHLITMRLRGSAMLLWSLFFRPLHDALLEECLDRAERALTGTVRTPARRSPHVRFLRRLAAAAGAGAARRRRRP
ncbi:SRPBCC family protein [Nocardiopsis algeriensis]|uniref:SRPBCC family protein n=1 Tax=Nocardiopsis algeriensis TaxID=1478215 RepID=A0A841IRE2_9ACTN|nr:hypothetical protein [Nocardiopsis algeriensis]